MRLVLFSVLCLFSLSFAVVALEAPKSDRAVILTVTGKIAKTNTDGAARLDRDLLEAIGWEEITTYNYFLDGAYRFGGVSLEALVAYLGVPSSATQITASALDDYTVTIPLSHIEEHDVFLAMDMDGRPMRVRDRGPIWVIYPKPDGKPTHDEGGLQIWQLTSMVIE